MTLYVGTAGWSISARHHGDRFAAGGSGLARYATRFRAVEINSSFYRPHRSATWRRWADTVPDDFRFSVKLPREMSHERRLFDCADPLARFAGEITELGHKLGAILVQLPPKFAFDPAALPFFAQLGETIPVPTACEPRHPSWFTPKVDRLLHDLRVARVAADPAAAPEAAVPGGWSGFAYWRLHGSPQMYRTPYDGPRLDAYATAIAPVLAASRDAWCIFDNTMSAAATGNALDLIERLAD